MGILIFLNVVVVLFAIILIYMKRMRFLLALVVIEMILMLVLIPLIINRMFDVPSEKVFFQTAFTQLDILLYISACLAFIGTMTLGFLSFWQNHSFARIENEKMRLLHMPTFLVQSSKSHEWQAGGGRQTDGLEYKILDPTKSYVFLNNKDSFGWISDFRTIGVPSNRFNEVLAITNCGNNSAHQVKVSFEIDGRKLVSERAYSVLKDESLYLFVSNDKKANLGNNVYIILRYFDAFQNVYEQKFKVNDIVSEIDIISYSNPILMKKGESMKGIGL